MLITVETIKHANTRSTYIQPRTHTNAPFACMFCVRKTRHCGRQPVDCQNSQRPQREWRPMQPNGLTYKGATPTNAMCGLVCVYVCICYCRKSTTQHNCRQLGRQLRQSWPQFTGRLLFLDGGSQEGGASRACATTHTRRALRFDSLINRAHLNDVVLRACVFCGCCLRGEEAAQRAIPQWSKCCIIV